MSSITNNKPADSIELTDYDQSFFSFAKRVIFAAKRIEYDSSKEVFFNEPKDCKAKAEALEACKETVFQNVGEAREWMSNSKNQKILDSIQELRLSNLRGELPKEIGKFKNLYKIELDNNRLESLPKEFTSLKNLKSLSLSNNKFKKVPSEIDFLIQEGSLQDIDLRINPLEKSEIEKYEREGKIRNCLNEEVDINWPSTESVSRFVNWYNAFKESIF